MIGELIEASNPRSPNYQENKILRVFHTNFRDTTDYPSNICSEVFAEPLQGLTWGYSFSGLNSYIKVSNPTIQFPDNSFTIIAWIRAQENRKDHRTIVSQGPKPQDEALPNASELHMEIYIEGAGPGCKLRSSPNNPPGGEFTRGEFRLYMPPISRTETNSYHHPCDFGSGFIVDDCKAHFVVVTRKDNTLKFYVDNKEGKSHLCQGSYPFSKNSIFIGRQSAMEKEEEMFFNGCIYRIEIHPRSLNIEELKEKHENFLREPSNHGLFGLNDFIEAEEVAFTSNFNMAPSEELPPINSILFLSADPTDLGRLRLSEEIREIEEKLQLARGENQILFTSKSSVRPADMSQWLLDIKPQIVHFSGHGAKSGELYIENIQGQAHRITPSALSALFRAFSKQVQCVVLNACYSEIQAQAIAQHIHYVIGTNHAISDRAAISFSVGFYQGLAAGRSVEGAYELGCALIELQIAEFPRSLMPILIKNGQHYSFPD